MSLDVNELRNDLNRIESQGQTNFLDNFVKMPDGEGIVLVRILPPRKEGKLYCVTRTHRLGAKNIHCPQNLVNGKWQGFCPVCNDYRRLWQESDKKSVDEAEVLRTEARQIKPLERYYYNVIVRSEMNKTTGEVEKDVGPKILSIGKQLHARIIRSILGDPAIGEEGLGDVTDFQSGRDFKIVKRIRKSGNESYPNYDDSKFVSPSIAGSDKQIAMWIEKMHDLQALRILKSNDELAKELRIYRGLEQDESLNFNAPAKTEMASQPVASKVDADTSLVEDDFIQQLRRM